QAAQQDRVHAAACRYGACDKQQGLTRADGHHHEAGFAEDDQKQNGGDPRTVIGYQQVEVDVEMQDKVKRVEIHGWHLCEWPDSAGPCGSSGNKATSVCRFSYNPERSALYGLRGEKPVGFVAG